jgi:hypothetical protein
MGFDTLRELLEWTLENSLRRDFVRAFLSRMLYSQPQHWGMRSFCITRCVAGMSDSDLNLSDDTGLRMILEESSVTAHGLLRQLTGRCDPTAAPFGEPMGSARIWLPKARSLLRRAC